MNKVNPLKKNKKEASSINHCKVRNLLYLGKAVKKLKSDGEITITSPMLDWGN